MNNLTKQQTKAAFCFSVVEYPSLMPSVSRGQICFHFFFFCVFCNISGVHHFGRDFCVCDGFVHPTTEKVTFRLRGWCMPGMFSLPAFTHLGQECQDLLSMCDGMHVCTD